MCSVDFKGQFVEPKNISKKAYRAKSMLDEVLHTKINGKTNAELIKKLPFDVFIYCKNPTKKATNPYFSFLVETEETPEQIGLIGLKHLTYSEDNKPEKIREFVLNFNKAFEKNDGVLPLTQGQKNAKLAELILLGYFNKK